MVYINAHTHHIQQHTDEVFELINIILSKDDLMTARPCSAGIHPWYVEEDLTDQMAQLAQIARSPHVLAIGECGLDKKTETNWELQALAFAQQIDLAKDLNKPLIVHCVRAFDEVIALLHERTPAVPVLFHGFNKHPNLGQSLLRKGYYLSLGTAVLSGRLDDLIKEIPLHRVLLETDQQKTEIFEIYAYFCRTRKIPMDRLQAQLMDNFRTVFNYSAVK